MEPVSIDVINRSVLISVFLIGLVLGGVISTIVCAYKDNQRKDYDRKD